MPWCGVGGGQHCPFTPAEMGAGPHTWRPHEAEECLVVGYKERVGAIFSVGYERGSSTILTGSKVHGGGASQLEASAGGDSPPSSKLRPPAIYFPGQRLGVGQSDPHCFANECFRRMGVQSVDLGATAWHLLHSTNVETPRQNKISTQAPAVGFHKDGWSCGYQSLHICNEVSAHQGNLEDI